MCYSSLPKSKRRLIRAPAQLFRDTGRMSFTLRDVLSTLHTCECDEERVAVCTKVSCVASVHPHNYFITSSQISSCHALCCMHTAYIVWLVPLCCSAQTIFIKIFIFGAYHLGIGHGTRYLLWQADATRAPAPAPAILSGQSVTSHRSLMSIAAA